MPVARIWLAAVAMLCLTWLTTGCSDRERANPLDPLNPKTHGKPVGLRAISLRDTVALSWQLLGLRGLSGYRIYRRAQPSAVFSLVDSVSGEISGFRESGLQLGRRHVYRITAFSPSTESNPSDTVSITPGPACTWVADPGGAVVKLTHDGLHEILRVDDLLEPIRLQANPKTGQVWVIDSLTGEVSCWEADGRFSGVAIELERPVDVALDTTENSIWVGDANLGLLKFDRAGTRVAQLSLPGISAIAFNYFTGELWALSNREKKLWRVNRQATSSSEINASLVSPRAISIARATGVAWIADSSRVRMIPSFGAASSAAGYDFSFARDVAVNQRTGDAWTIDWSPAAGQSKIVKFSSVGVMVFSVADFSGPSALSVNVFDGSCFIAEPQLSRVTHVSLSGQIISRSADVAIPADIDVENRPLN